MQALLAFALDLFPPLLNLLLALLPRLTLPLRTSEPPQCKRHVATGPSLEYLPLRTSEPPRGERRVATDPSPQNPGPIRERSKQNGREKQKGRV